MTSQHEFKGIIRNKVEKKCEVAATVKANAYGLGVEKIVPSLIKSGCKFFLLQLQMRQFNYVRLIKKYVFLF